MTDRQNSGPVGHGEADYANWGWRNEWIGYYGVNPATNIAVTGPYDRRRDCVRAIRKINATPPIARDLLVLKVVR